MTFFRQCGHYIVLFFTALQYHNIFLTVALTLLLFAAFGYIILLPYPHWVGIFSLASIGLTSVIIGGFFGFLFGIPRHHATQTNQIGETTPPTLPDRENTNLYDISDWITKIIVGIGLVELTNVSTNFESLVNFLSSDLHLPSRAICGLVIVGSFVIGFFMSYFWARIDFTHLLVVEEKIVDTNVEIVLNRAEIDLQIMMISNKPYFLPSETKDNKVKLEEIIRQSPLNRRAVLLRARYSVRGDNNAQEAIGILLDFIQNKKARSQTNDTDYADALYNLACYHAMGINDLLPREGKKQLLDKVMEYLRESVGTYPANRGDAEVDPDFANIKNTAEWRAVFG
jgi:hypothetical protein